MTYWLSMNRCPSHQSHHVASTLCPFSPTPHLAVSLEWLYGFVLISPLPFSNPFPECFRKPETFVKTKPWTTVSNARSFEIYIRNPQAQSFWIVQGIFTESQQNLNANSSKVVGGEIKVATKWIRSELEMKSEQHRLEPLESNRNTMISPPPTPR